MWRALKILVCTAFALLALTLALLPWIGPPLLSYVVSVCASESGIPLEARSDFGYCWTPSGPGLKVTGHVGVPGTDWRVFFSALAAFSRYEARVHLPEVAFSEREPLTEELLRRYPQNVVSNLSFAGKVALDASVTRTWSFPVPEWHVKLPVRDFRAYGELDRMPLTAEGLGFTFEADGVADRLRIVPTRIRARQLAAGGHELTNFYASVWNSGTRLLVSQAGAAYCGGNLVLQSLYLDFNDLDAGCTVYVENADARALLRSCAGFKGEATGRLNGRLPLFIRKGQRISLRNGYLYSPPGERGKFKLDNPEEFSGQLALAGLDDETRGNVANALSDMDYDILRLSVDREREGFALRLLLRGTATRGDTTVPVSFDITLHGDLEYLINAGLKVSGRKEQIR